MRLTAQYLYNELIERGIPVEHMALGKDSFFSFDYKGRLRMISGICTDLTTATAQIVCDNKDITARLAEKIGFNVPATLVCEDFEAAVKFLKANKKVVVKPVNGAHGNGVVTNVTTEDELRKAMKVASSAGRGQSIIIQQQVSGADYRVLVIDGEVVAVAERTPASVKGDGVHSIAELIDIENKTNPDRDADYQKKLNYIDSKAARIFLGDEIKEVPAKGQVVSVVGTANIGSGGKSIDRTNELPKETAKEAGRVSSAIGAFVCGVDYIYDKSLGEWFLIELNKSPSFGLHQTPSEGDPIEVTKIFVDKLLAKYDSGSHL